MTPRRLVLALLALAVLVAPGRGPRRAAADDGTPVDAGLAVEDLTPSRPGPLAGYAARFGTTHAGVHDPVRARALVVDDGATKVALVAVDLLGVTAEAKAAVLAKVAARGFTSATLLLAATHTHSGPGGLADVPLFRPMTGPFDRARFDEVTARIARAVERADDARAPARLALGATRAPGLQRNREQDGGPVDDRLGVLRVDGLDGTPRGLVVHFAAHPTILPASSRVVSAEWPGATCDALEARYPGAVAMVLQGALGDVAPTGVPGDGPAAVEAYGRRVAEHAVDAVEGARRLRAPRCSAHAATVTLPPTVAGPLLRRTAGSALAPGDRPRLRIATRAPAGGSPAAPPADDAVQTEVAVLGFAGPDGEPALELVAVPGEPTVACAAEALGPPGRGTTWAVACANDHLGYLTDRAAFRRGGYEASLDPVGPGAAAWLRDAIARTGAVGAAVPVTLPRPPRAAATHRLAVVRGATPYELGRAHGTALATEIFDLLRAAEPRLADEAGADALRRELTLAALATGRAPRDLVVPALVRAVRRLQRHVPPALLDEMEGVADGAGVPYDAILLENLFLTLAEQPDPAALLRLPVRCTNGFAAGPATTLGQAVVVSTLDWGLEDVLGPRTVVLVVDPPTGHPFVSVTWPGMVGVLRGMGAQGLAVTEESVACPDDSRADGVPVNLLLRDVLQHADGLADAVARVVAAPGTCGHHLLLADGHRRDARVVERSATRTSVRRPADGLLLGCDPTDAACFDGACDPRLPRADASGARRYAAWRPRLAALAGRLDAVRALDALAASDGVFGAGTLLACGFEPQTGRFWTATRGAALPDPVTGALALEAFDLDTLLGRDDRARFAPRGVGAAGVATGPSFPIGTVERVPVTLPSPRPSGVARNDLVEAAWFAPTRRPVLGALVQLPAWRERDLAAESLVAAGLASQGFGVLLLPLPWQANRAAPGVPPGEWTLSADLARTREAWAQGLADVARASAWLEARGVPPARQGIFGISLGGHVAAVALGAYPDRFRAGAFVLAGGGLEKVLDADEPHLRAAKAALAEKGVAPADLRALVEVLDPLGWANPARRADVFLVGARADELVPASRVEALATAWGGAEVLWLDGDHMGALREAPRILDGVVRHFRRAFGDR